MKGSLDTNFSSLSFILFSSLGAFGLGSVRNKNNGNDFNDFFLGGGVGWGGRGIHIPKYLDFHVGYSVPGTAEPGSRGDKAPPPHPTSIH